VPECAYALLGWAANITRSSLEICCYYQAIDIAIKLGLSTVRAGPGEHKPPAAYLPRRRVASIGLDEVFLRAVQDYLVNTNGAPLTKDTILTITGPFKRVEVTERDERLSEETENVLATLV